MRVWVCGIVTRTSLGPGLRRCRRQQEWGDGGVVGREASRSLLAPGGSATRMLCLIRFLGSGG